MITHEDVKNLVIEWRLREDIIEKDYVIGWLLWGIGSDPDIGHNWIFKGGTCIKKCYIETYRFSEDLDFTVLPDGIINPEELLPIFNRILKCLSDESGINFLVNSPRFEQRDSPLSAEGRIYYRGPRNAPNPGRIKLDLSAEEKVARPSVLRKIAHPYSDELPSIDQVRCYSLEELFAEKIRAMGERSRPRDLYDIINLFRRRDLQVHPEIIRATLIKKCESKNISVPTFESIKNLGFLEELKSEWENMLGHQLQVLPPFEHFWEELPQFFNWLEQTYTPEKITSIPIQKEDDITWTPPPTTWSWGIGVPLESIRYAAANHLCVELGYRNSKRVIEPYSLRRTKDGYLILHAIRVDNRQQRGYRVDRIQSINVTTIPFKPLYQIEFSSTGPISTLPTSRKKRSLSSGLERRKTHFGPTYIFECSYCGKKFKRVKYDSKLNPHKDKNGWNCPGRIGYFIETRYN
jgi:predicted nucleotidyltransferase component of viral defense system